jgi:hypothetical protein
MVIAILVFVMVIILFLFNSSLRVILTLLPYLSGLLVVVFLRYNYDLEIGQLNENVVSVIILIMIETVIMMLSKVEQTSGPVILLLSMLFIGLLMLVIMTSLKVESLQRAIILTVIYVVGAVFVSLSNWSYNGVIRYKKRGLVLSIIVALIYAFVIGINIFIVDRIWYDYISLSFSENALKSSQNIVAVITIIIMVCTGCISLIRDRREAMYEEG